MIAIEYLYNFQESYKLNILHIDMDAFYASVEEEDNPKIKGRPVIVGGSSKHGIVTTANYEARKYGIHSAMPIFMARQKCPHGLYLPTRIDRYKEASKEVFEGLYEFTDVVEAVSIDEAYLDISELDICPKKIALEIKEEVLKRTGLTMSVGISYNKFLAKLASDWNKPKGIKVITESMVPEILLDLSVRTVHGIGSISAKRLNEIGIYRVKDLLGLKKEFLVDFFGKQGIEIYQRIRGRDDRIVETHRERKSLGTETTFSDTIKDLEILKKYLYDFSLEVSDSLERKSFHGRTITVKVKYEDFTQRTKSKTLENETNKADDIYKWAKVLLEEIPLNKSLRLIGLSISNLASIDYKQLSFIN